MIWLNYKCPGKRKKYCSVFTAKRETLIAATRKHPECKWLSHSRVVLLLELWPLKRYIYVPTPGTWESDHLWQYGLCTCKQIKMRSYLIRMGPIPIRLVSYKKRRDLRRENKQCWWSEVGGMSWMGDGIKEGTCYMSSGCYVCGTVLHWRKANICWLCISEQKWLMQFKF